MAGYVTVSVDDGTSHDLRVAHALATHGLGATFYVPAQAPRELDRPALQTLDQSFEIGSHGFNHVDLTTLSLDAVARELHDGKAWLEDVLGHNVKAFAYPFGGFNRDVAALVEREGFACARTCLLNRSDFPRDPYRMGMTTDACSYPRRAQLRYGLQVGNFRGLRNYLVAYHLERDWEAHFRRALEVVGGEGGIAHLVVHSAEIEKRDDWAKLDRVLRAAATTTLTPVTNSQAVLARQ